MGIAVRKGKYMLRTSCGKCDATFANTQGALRHLDKQHRVKKYRKPDADGSIFKVRWNRKGLIDQEIGLDMSMGGSWGARVPENAT